LQNIWRCIPFLDLSVFIAQLAQDGVPLIQEEAALCPQGDALESFRVLPRVNQDRPAFQDIGRDIVGVAVDILLGLGVAPNTIADGATQIAFTGDRAKGVQSRR
jgi:hypothetical protein